MGIYTNSFSRLGTIISFQVLLNVIGRCIPDVQLCFVLPYEHAIQTASEPHLQYATLRCKSQGNLTSKFVYIMVGLAAQSWSDQGF